MEKKIFKNLVLVKSFLFLLIVFWGGYNSTVVGVKPSDGYISDIGNALFMVFSILYLWNAFFLLKFKILGRLTFLPLVFAFVFLGFLSETLNPMEIKRDYFYLTTFYIISPLFFIVQGMVYSMLIAKDFRKNFH